MLNQSYYRCIWTQRSHATWLCCWLAFKNSANCCFTSNPTGLFKDKYESTHTLIVIQFEYEVWRDVTEVDMVQIPDYTHTHTHTHFACLPHTHTHYTHALNTAMSDDKTIDWQVQRGVTRNCLSMLMSLIQVVWFWSPCFSYSSACKPNTWANPRDVYLRPWRWRIDSCTNTWCR